MMVLTQKETMLLEDLKRQEQVCIDKYERYAQDACDPTLGTLFWELSRTERDHLAEINRILDGKAPGSANGAGGQTGEPANDDFKRRAVYTTLSDGEDKCTDAYLCADALSMEKHVSSFYDTAIFEFAQQELRDALNAIQRQEQEHGKRIYDYMAANGMPA